MLPKRVIKKREKDLAKIDKEESKIKLAQSLRIDHYIPVKKIAKRLRKTPYWVRKSLGLKANKKRFNNK
jgi:hypothetical protein